MSRHPLASLVLGVLPLVGMACGGSNPPPPSGVCTVTGISATASANPVAPSTPDTLTAVVNSSGSGCSNAVVWSFAPGVDSTGTTLTSTGNLTATFSATTAAVYGIVATSKDNSTQSATIQVTVSTSAGIALWDVALWDSSTWQ